MIATRRHAIFKLKIGKRSVRRRSRPCRGDREEAVGDRARSVDVNPGRAPTSRPVGSPGLQAIVASSCRAADPHRLRRGPEIADRAHRDRHHGPTSSRTARPTLAVAAERAADVFAVKTGQSGGLEAPQRSSPSARPPASACGGHHMLRGRVPRRGAAALLDRRAFPTGAMSFRPLLLKDEILSQPIAYHDFAVHLPPAPGLASPRPLRRRPLLARPRPSLHPVAWTAPTPDPNEGRGLLSPAAHGGGLPDAYA